MLKLTDRQQEACDSIKAYLVDPNRFVYTLSGVGGAGKSTLIKLAVEGKQNIVGATISHSAKFVLDESLRSVGASCYTVAQLLGLTQTITEDGEVKFIPKKTNKFQTLPIETARILIIDECSMIDDKVYNDIMSMKRDDCKVIFLGDVFQLAPVEGNTDSITFKHTEVELHESVRYSGPISDLGTMIRSQLEKIHENQPVSQFFLNEWMEDGVRTSKVNSEGSGYIFLNKIEDVVRIAKKEFSSNEDPEAMRIIGYKNSTIEKINHVIRHQLFGGDEDEVIPQFMPNELVVCNGGYSVKPGGAGFPLPVIYNNQGFKVKGVMEVVGPHDVNCLAMNLSPEVRLPVGASVYALDWEKGRHSYFEILNELRRNAKVDGKQWPQYYDFKAKFCEFDYGYALNSHKSQGRTFTDVIVFENDIFSVKKNSFKNKLQSFYVACTRAKRRVYIYNNKYRVDQSDLPDFVKEELGL